MKAFAVTIIFALILGANLESSSTTAAKKFLAALNSDQRRKATFPPGSDQIYDFHFVPRNVPGITWKELSAIQRELGDQLLRSCLSKVGYTKAESIRSLEPVLRQIENGNPARDHLNYGFAFFGDPTDTGPWALRYEGHHLSLTFAFEQGRVVASTPQFLGTNPAEVRSGVSKGTRVLAKEQDIAFDLLNSLDSGQKSVAVISDTAPADILTMNAREAKIPQKGGIAFTRLTASQQAILLRLVRAHAEVQSESETDRRMKQLQGQAASSLVFVWMGSLAPGKAHYYRIQGSDLLIEYDNTQNGANHIHSVWRNPREDFGKDPLIEHYQSNHRH